MSEHGVAALRHGDPSVDLRVHLHPGAILDRTFLPARTKMVDDAVAPDLVAIATGRRSPVEIQGQILRARLRFGWRPLVIAHYGEIVGDPAANETDLDQVFSFAPSGGKNTRHERYWRFPHLAAHIAAREAQRPDSLWARPKTRFCNFVASNAHPQKNTDVRERFVQQLMAHGPVDCPGRVLNNTRRLPPNPVGDATDAAVSNAQLAKLEFLSSYRFTVAFENTSAHGYITEKIVHPLIAGSIPVYWGSPDVAERYNPDAFVNCHDFGSFGEVIERILEIEGDPSRLEAMRRAPMLHADSCIPELHKHLEARWRELAEAAISRRDLVLPPAKRLQQWTALARRSTALACVGHGRRLPLNALALLLSEATGVHGVRFLKRRLATLRRRIWR